MAYYYIQYDGGSEIVEADDLDDATDIAYQAWREYADCWADCWAEELTVEHCYMESVDPAKFGLEAPDTK